MLVSLAFRLAVLATGTWAVFCRPSRASVPRLRLFRCVVAALATVFLASFWLFYARLVESIQFMQDSLLEFPAIFLRHAATWRTARRRT